ncbi:hypothetical protein ACTXIV_02795 [Psychrobacter celer]|uniref:hypothetical protein n=1 Tax=Psychrobacter celer TaxID=306572 RepID=UPI003FD2BD65
MQTPMSPILAITVVLFTTIVVVPGVFILWKKWSFRRLQNEEEVWDILRAERALNENEGSDEHRDLFFRAIIKGNITQRKKAKIRLILWLIFLFFWTYLIFSYLYFSLDRSAPTLTFLDSFDPLVVTFGVLAFVAGLLSAFYEKTKLRNIDILLHDFGEAHGIEGRVTLEKLEKLDSIKKLR